MSKFPDSHAGDFLAASALSLSLAGIFHDGGGRGEMAAEGSSENSAPLKSRSEEDYELGDGEQNNGDEDDEDDDGIDGEKKNKKRKKHHRHTPDQIRKMEALFKESPHPDEKQRVELSKQLGLHPRQVKFWFQNRRTQIKAIQERHENSLLKNEIDRLRHENKALWETVNTSSCPSCGYSSSTGGPTNGAGGDEQRLRIENSKLKAEVEKLRSVNRKHSNATSSNNTSFSGTSRLEMEKPRLMEVVNQATEELRRMATHGEPLWVRSYETGREILNYDVYVKEFPPHEALSDSSEQKKSIEASRDSRTIFVHLPWLVQSFMDVNRWKELFPCLISKAEAIDDISIGEGDNKDGAIVLIHAEIQMLTPMVPAREMQFIRHCKKLSATDWAILDISVDKIEEKMDLISNKCRKRPSGCIIEDKSNGHCKVTWVEHLECRKSTVHSSYRPIVNSGLAFSAKRWISTLQQQCERLVFLVATNVPTKNSNGVATLAGRKSILTLAQRMTCSFCRTLGASSANSDSWKKITSKTGDNIRIVSRNNLNDNGEPLGTIMCAISCAWFPVTQQSLFDFLRDEKRRHEWDVMFKGNKAQVIANLAKGQDPGNVVTALAMNPDEHKMRLLQDCSTNSYESMVVYSPVGLNGMESVIAGCDSSCIQVLPSGFSILPDGIESKPFLISCCSSSRSSDEKRSKEEGGSVLTFGFQVLISSSNDNNSSDSVDSITSLVSSSFQNIRRSLQCQE